MNIISIKNCLLHTHSIYFFPFVLSLFDVDGSIGRDARDARTQFDEKKYDLHPFIKRERFFWKKFSCAFSV